MINFVEMPRIDFLEYSISVEPIFDSFNCLLHCLHFRQSRHKIPAAVAFAIAFVAGALFLPFLEDETVFQCETGSRREAFHRFNRLRVFVVFLQHALQLEVSSAAGFDVIEMVLELGEDVLGKDGVGHERL